MTRVWAVALSVAFTAGAPVADASNGMAAPAIDVRHDDGTYRVTATFLIDEAPPAAFAVLTDYERIPEFMPDVRSSVIRERADGHALIEQEAHPRLLMFSKKVHLLLDVTETADRVAFVDRSGRSFVSYVGHWQLAGEASGTRITYQLAARPAFDVPSFVLTRLLRKNAGEMIARLRAEIAARAR
jgi:carbon monoxide dehydrogenase subunit G